MNIRRVKPTWRMAADGWFPFSSFRSDIEIGPYRIEDGMERTEEGALAPNASDAAAIAAFVTGDSLVEIFFAAFDILWYSVNE